MAQGPQADRAFTYNDEYGMMLMRILQDAGFCIPDDLALVGCDNLPIDELMRPRLTSVLIGAADSDGSGIAELLDGLIRGTVGEDSVRFLSKPQLIVRELS